MLTFGSIIAADAREDTKHDARPWWNHSAAWSSSNKPGNGTRAEANHSVLAVVTVIEQTPDNTADSGSDTRIPSSNSGPEVSSKCGTRVKAYPSEPQHKRAQADEGYVMRAEVDKLALMTAPKDPCVSKTANTRADLDRTTSGVVQHTPFECPPVHVPGLINQGGISTDDVIS